MPSYPHLYEDTIPWDDIQDRVDGMAMLGVPYSAAALNDADGLARTQAAEIAAQIVAQGGPAGLEDNDVTALIAYIQRLGQDIKVDPIRTASVEK